MNTHNRTKFLPAFATLILAAGQLSADDTEIYLSTGLDILDDAAKPNLMFLMDTSGSMGSNIAVEVPSDGSGFEYDELVDYGSSDDDLIYVYDTDYEFQNVTLTYDQSVCDSMEDFFDDNPGFPIYSDRALQWQSSTTTQTIEETEITCVDVDVDSATIEIEEDGRVDNGDWDYYGPYAAGAGTDFIATGTTYARNDRIRMYVRIGSYPTSNNYECRKNDIRNESETCTVSVGGSDEDIYVGIRGRRNNSDYDLDITYGGSGTIEECTEVTTQTDIEVTEANWSEALENTVETDWVLECRGDRGDHGIDSVSNDDYVRNCGTNDCTEPRYTSSRNNEYNWNGIDTRVFMTANYHDYILLFGAPEPGTGTLPSGNSNSTCSSQAEGYQFVDDGVTYECVEKLSLMQSSATELITSLDNMNLGLARLASSSAGGYVLEKVRDIDSDYSTGVTVEDRYISTVNALPASGGTPLAESLWEMMLYMSGDNVFYGDDSGTSTDPAAVSSGEYNSPIINSCQSNNVIVLTDGEPTSDSGRDTAINNLTGGNCSSSSYATTADGTCLDELAEYMASHDMSAGPNGVSGTQTIRTYTIGFDIDLPLLQTTANKGQGQYFTVSNAFELRSAFTTILVDILSDSTTFVAPAISVNAFNQLQHRNEIYYAVFKPNNSPRWTGNVKKYTISSDGTILDANGLAAVDPGTGYFADTAQDIWSSTMDGNTVDAGGFRDLMPDNRRVFTYIGDSPNEVNLTGGSGAYQFNTSNSLVTRELLGLEASASNSARNNLILWGSGEDLYDADGDMQTNDANRFVGDALHSRPYLVTYGGTEETPYDILYVGSNMGFLHAVDGATGVELWSFIPDDLIGNIKQYQEGNASEPKAYGLDGEITLLVNESKEDSDLNIEPADGDYIYLYQGMRRGGKDYYAFDVSNYNPNNLDGIYPILKWKIDGGVGEYNDMGQSWSRMISGTVNWECSGEDCTERDVMFFSGGYDADVHDNATEVTTGDLGNAIYMIDAHTGELLWSVGNNSDARTTHTHSLGLADMNNSIPGSPNVADIDGDGIIDMVFAVDIAGNVFRYDLNDETTNDSNFATGGQIFELNQAGEFKRFYNQPDLVLSEGRGYASYLNLVFGSGYMSSPRDADESDYIYVLFEDDIFYPPTDENGDVEYINIGTDSLWDPWGTDVPADKFVNAPYGYYVPLSGNGEKMLRPGLIFNGIVTYTSYNPEGNTNADACSGGLIGGSRLYQIDLDSGRSVIDSPTDDPFIELLRPGISPEGTVIFVDGDEVVCFGTECYKASDPDGDGPDLGLGFGDDRLTREYWREEEANDDD